MARILHAEDHDEIAFMVQFLLEDEGHEVIHARDGVEALEEYEHNGADIVLIDVMMPRMDGFELCRRLAEKAERPGLIIISAKDRVEDFAAGEAAGVDAYLPKPLEPDDLIAKINELLAR